MKKTRTLSILIVGGHPADAFDCAGGTLAHHVERGDRVTAAVLTHGARSHSMQLIDDLREGRLKPKSVTDGVIAQHAQVKHDEVTEACALLGITDVRRLAYEDDVLLLNNELIFWIDEIIREVKPDIVISHHPQETVDVHNVCARATYEPFAKQIILVDTPGAASSNLKSFNFTKRPKPLYPFEDTTEPELIVKVSKDVHN